MKRILPSLMLVILLAPAMALTSEYSGSANPPQQKTPQNHFVQFFSSIDATKAEGMKNTLKLQGYPAFVNINTPASTKQTFYQVQVGPFATRDIALDAKRQVVQKYPEYDFLNDAILRTSL